ncbi:MAG: hypothetical protein GX817_01870 [Elusimicrobia bacterium]|nr:hypothetical protein [Elusimicrobiota bacterium]
MKKYILILVGLVFFAPQLDAAPFFYNEDPTSDPGYGNLVDFYLTLESTGAPLDMASIKYRVSNSGNDLLDFSPWRTDWVYVSSSSHKALLKASIPNNSDDVFLIGDDNYIDWQAFDMGSPAEASSAAMYRIRILQNTEPKIKIIQPNNIAILAPKIVVDVLSYSLAIDTYSIVLDIKDAYGKSIHSVTGADAAALYSKENEKIIYNIPPSLLKEGQEYELSVSLSDFGYIPSDTKSVSKTTKFTTASGGIADFVAYPNPFDSRSEESRIRFVLKEEASVTLNVYDTSGSLVKELLSGDERGVGLHEVLWDGRSFSGGNLANGVYYCEIIADATSEYRNYTVIAIHRK